MTLSFWVKCFYGLIQVVRLLSASEPSVSGVNSVDDEGWAPLHSAASSGNADIVEILLSRGDDFICSPVWRMDFILLCFWSLRFS